MQRPEDRYGTKPATPGRGRWIAIALTALVIVAGVAIAAIGYNRLGPGDVKGELSAYKLVDSSTVSVTASVERKDPSKPAVCILRARSIDGSETGRREVLVPPSAERSVPVTALVKTTRPPVTGDVYGCSLAIPSYLVAS
ncbi:Conserved membrane protein of uncharacterised function [Mycobacteroides abscessus subsp. abscessus]|uniref:DUF4307 domain-containing protein n=10 Tax=Mycobacteroides abscessus TaxID=36809 RepID=B1MKJ8_MYCA9|nr:DUF4307 domain-containing protein [Mycobacteroides abscessus]ESV58998.1 hypothetical protein L830_4850 [Mycobacteroides abscessus MAB_082312_2258]ESV62382.1 hypothetical protein L833_4787 [Mycobacteroides abscessus MAB_091912_2446]EUA47429.1 hypothetical protein I543_1367 [Mycobacteroides abscessus 21]EUA65148.1 hypothetical protein I542_5328 [Mycobacteroides abscessus 1948]EUA71438.1 hypothetical protein I540_1137 [Mycobacteroides abscessus subsp. bolletii 1513]